MPLDTPSPDDAARRRERLRARRPVLVTGSQRSGTTWVGRVLAESPDLRLVYEPFNHHHHERKVTLPHPAREHFHTVSPEDEGIWLRFLEHRVAIADRKSGSRLGNWLSAFCTKPRPLLKDPIALLSADWLISTFDCPTVLMIRHPAAYASSLARLDWRISLPALASSLGRHGAEMEGLREEITRSVEGGAPPILEEACLAWRALAAVGARLMRRHPSKVLLVRNEDLSCEPWSHFARIHEHLGVRWTARAQELVRALTSEDNPTEAGGEVHQLARNSRANVWVWRERLSAADTARIRDLTADWWPRYYESEDWEGAS